MALIGNFISCIFYDDKKIKRSAIEWNHIFREHLGVWIFSGDGITQ